jgi:hypothetical protein
MKATLEQPQATPEKLEFTVTVQEDGSLSFPDELKNLLCLDPGKKIPVTFENGEAKIPTPQERGRRAQEMLAEYMRVHDIPVPTDTGADRIRKMRDEDAAIEAERGR